MKLHNSLLGSLFGCLLALFTVTTAKAESLPIVVPPAKDGANVLRIINQTNAPISVGPLERRSPRTAAPERKLPLAFQDIKPHQEAEQMYYGMYVCYAGTSLMLSSPEWAEAVVIHFDGSDFFDLTFKVKGTNKDSSKNIKVTGAFSSSGFLEEASIYTEKIWTLTVSEFSSYNQDL